MTILLAGYAGASNVRERLAAQLVTLPDCYAGVDDLPSDAGIIVRGLAVDARAAQSLTTLVQSSLVPTRTDDAPRPRVSAARRIRPSAS